MLQRYPKLFVRKDIIEDRILEIRLDELQIQLSGLKETLSEKDYRRVPGALANDFRWGGIQAVHDASGSAYSTVQSGGREKTALISG